MENKTQNPSRSDKLWIAALVPTGILLWNYGPAPISQIVVGFGAALPVLYFFGWLFKVVVHDDL